MGKEIKALNDIKGFDDVGIGVIWLDEGKGTYIRCADLEGYDLTDIQIYRYNNAFRTMRTVDKLEKDSEMYAFCVKREDVMEALKEKNEIEEEIEK